MDTILAARLLPEAIAVVGTIILILPEVSIVNFIKGVIPKSLLQRPCIFPVGHFAGLRDIANTGFLNPLLHKPCLQPLFKCCGEQHVRKLYIRADQASIAAARTIWGMSRSMSR